MSRTARATGSRVRRERPAGLSAPRIPAAANLAYRPAGGAKAGHALAALHRQRGPQYGWHRDNFIGSTVQHNAEHRHLALLLCPPAACCRSSNWPGDTAQYNRLIASGERLADALPALFVDHQPQPSLLHGDLWSGNAALDDSGRLALFDPAVYWGDRETDLAMSELFGGFPDSFHAAYREAWPLTDGCASASCCTSSTMCSTI
ncbi:MAG: fructosamine kinase family protein [Candidatus Accumulibacter propinquus]